MNKLKDQNPVYVLGTSISHNGSACLLRDGEIVVAIEVERVTRMKRDGYEHINHAIHYCLEAEGIKEEDLSLKVYSTTEYPCIHNRYGIEINHHLAHAASAFYTSPFENSVILVLDGSGNPRYWNENNNADDPLKACSRETESMCLGTSRNIALLKKNYGGSYQGVETSIGGAFEIVSKLIFDDQLEGGKVMGLAPYGDINNNIPPIFTIENDKPIFSPSWFNQLRHFDLHNLTWESMISKNLARHVQIALENYLEFILGELYQLSKSLNLCYAGGVALNCVANSKVLIKGPFKNVFIQPAANDAGLAIGCAYYGYYNIMGHNRRSFNLPSMYLGKSYTDDEIEKELVMRSSLLQWDKLADPVPVASKSIADGKIVGWYQGKSEFGPRALGNRSILFDPRHSKAKDILNSRVKHREPFRPFGASCLIDFLQDWFEENRVSPYMLFANIVKVHKRHLIPGIVHIDGSCRIQTVSMSENPVFYKLIKRFFELTDLPMVLNTSFNIMGEPIVETPGHAMDCFIKTLIDELYCGSYLIRRRNLSQNSIRELYFCLALDVELIIEYSKKTPLFFLRRKTGYPRVLLLSEQQAKILGFEFKGSIFEENNEIEFLKSLIFAGWIMPKTMRPK